MSKKERYVHSDFKWDDKKTKAYIGHGYPEGLGCQQRGVKEVFFVQHVLNPLKSFFHTNYEQFPNKKGGGGRGGSSLDDQFPVHLTKAEFLN